MLSALREQVGLAEVELHAAALEGGDIQVLAADRGGLSGREDPERLLLERKQPLPRGASVLASFPAGGLLVSIRLP